MVGVQQWASLLESRCKSLKHSPNYEQQQIKKNHTVFVRLKRDIVCFQEVWVVTHSTTCMLNEDIPNVESSGLQWAVDLVLILFATRQQQTQLIFPSLKTPTIITHTRWTGEIDSRHINADTLLTNKRVASSWTSQRTHATYTPDCNRMHKRFQF